MKTALILAPYPSTEDLRDGYYQRLKSVDRKLNQWHRTYLGLSRKRHFRAHVEHPEPGITFMQLNVIRHASVSLELFRQADIIVMPSINSLRLSLWLLIVSGALHNTHLVLDVHGAAPEEAFFKGRRVYGHYSQWIERLVFRHTQTFLFVTDAMKKFYLEKYPHIRTRELIVFPNVSVLEHATGFGRSGLPAIDIKPNDVVFIYSGNLQAWQNVPLMLETIKKLHNPHYRFVVLTMKPSDFGQIAQEMGITNLIVRSVSPWELAEYYKLAHYGFVLRDSHILNRVACPTKLVEYLLYGITPIVLSEEIGDFSAMGYEYIRLDEISSSMSAKKSAKNVEIAQRLVQQSEDTTLSSHLHS